MEIGIQLNYKPGNRNLSIGVDLRKMLFHEAEKVDNWGAAVVVKHDPGAAGEGFSYKISPQWGAVKDGVNPQGKDQLEFLDRGNTSEVDYSGSMLTELSYNGLMLGNSAVKVTPFTKLNFGADRNRLDFGARFEKYSLNLEVVANQSEENDHRKEGIQLRTRIRFKV